MGTFGHGPSLLDLAKNNPNPQPIVPDHYYVFVGLVNVQLVRAHEIGEFTAPFCKNPQRLKAFFETELPENKHTEYEINTHYMSSRHLCPELDVFLNMLANRELTQQIKHTGNSYKVEWQLPITKEESRYLHSGLKYPHANADNALSAFLHLCFEPVFRLACAPFNIKGNDITIFYSGQQA